VGAALGEGWGAECLMLSQIGRPIDDPAVVDLQLRSGIASAPSGSKAAIETAVGAVVHDHLGRLSQLRDELIAETIVPF